MKPVTLIALIALVTAVPCQAQLACKDSDTIAKCWQDVEDQSGEEGEEGEEKTEAAMETAAEEDLLSQIRSLVQREATGLGLALPGLESATEDFLPLFRFALAAAGAEDFAAEAEDFEFKLPLGDRSPVEIKLSGTLNDLAVFEPLKVAIPDAAREARVTALKEALKESDDFTVGLHANRVSKTLGRTVRQELFADLFEAIVKEHATRFPEPTFDAFVRSRELRSQFADPSNFEAGVNLQNPLSIRFEQIANLELREELKAKTVELARETALGTQHLRELAEEFGLFRLADLAHNQPQLHGSLSYHSRDDAAGPDALAAKLTYEYSWANLNRANKATRACAAEGRSLLTCFGSYLTANEKQIAKENRLSFSLVYDDRQDFSFSVPELSTPFELPSGQSLVIKLTYGRSAGNGFLTAGDARIDLSSSYENVDDDPSRQDRGVATLTYSDRMLKALGVSLSISYANHAKFLPDTDDELSAHFGISLRAHGDAEEKE